MCFNTHLSPVTCSASAHYLAVASSLRLSDLYGGAPNGTDGLEHGLYSVQSYVHPKASDKIIKSLSLLRPIFFVCFLCLSNGY